MGPVKRRALLYGTGTCIAGSLLLGAFVLQPRPEPKPLPDISKMLLEANIDTRFKDYAHARMVLAQVFAIEPSNWKALWMDGYCAECEGKTEQALARYRAVLESKELTPKQAGELQAAIERLEAPAPPPLEGPKKP